MSTIVRKLIETDSELIEAISSKVTTETGRQFFYIPYWFEKTGPNLFIEYRFEDLPTDLIDEIKKQRNGGI